MVLFIMDMKVSVFSEYFLFNFSYMICWVPFHVVFDVSAVDPTLVPDIIYTITFWLTYINSTINPILYNFSSKDFRKAFKDIICRSE